MLGGRKGFGLMLLALAVFALWTEPGLLRRNQPIHWIPAGLTSSLVVPGSSILLRLEESPLSPGDRVTGVRLEPNGSLINLIDRRHLVDLLNRGDTNPTVTLEVKRGGASIEVETPTRHSRPSTRIIENWAIGLVGMVYLLFGLAAFAGGQHPVASPLFATSFCLGLSLFAAYDLIIPEDRGLLLNGALSGRASLLALTFLPATFIHLAMRFPVVHMRFRNPGMAASGYALFAVPALFGQLRFYDGAVVQAMLRLTEVSTVLALSILLITSIVNWRSLKPVEQSRAAALIIGGVPALCVPVASLLVQQNLPARTSTLLIFSLAVLPLSLSWAVARYRLLEPPRWLRDAVSSALLVIVAYAIAIGLALLIPNAFRRPLDTFGDSLAIAALTVAFYQCIRIIYRKVALGGSFASHDQILAETTMKLAGAKSPQQVVSLLTEVIRKRLEPASISTVWNAEPHGVLAERGMTLWQDHECPERSIVLAGARVEDPDPERPEAVLPLSPMSGFVVLVVISSRWNGLPYSDEEVRVFRGLREIATVSMGHTAKSAELEHLVTKRTDSLRRSLQQRAAVLDTVRRIQAAEDAHDVAVDVERFMLALAGSAKLVPENTAEVPDRLLARLESSRGTWCLGSERLTAREKHELAPQLETVCAFANLVLARLKLLDELTEKVHAQSAELASIQTRRRHAEFVRGVAHELRKPTEEAHHIGVELTDQLDGDLAEQAGRIAAVTQEMNRRIDLLMFHSDIRYDFRRIDLVPLLGDALQRNQVRHPGRRYARDHEFERLPVVGDPSRLLSVFENLIDNAAKATSEGGSITLRSGLVRSAGEGDALWAYIEVEDDGTGITTEESVDHLFQPGVSHFSEGFGLGLALCREVVEAHTGRIEVDSEPGRTLFRVVIPQFMNLGADA